MYDSPSVLCFCIKRSVRFSTTFLSTSYFFSDRSSFLPFGYFSLTPFFTIKIFASSFSFLSLPPLCLIFPTLSIHPDSLPALPDVFSVPCQFLCASQDLSHIIVFTATRVSASQADARPGPAHLRVLVPRAWRYQEVQILDVPGIRCQRLPELHSYGSSVETPPRPQT